MPLLSSDSYARYGNSFHTSLADKKDITKALNDISLNASNGKSFSTACSAIILAVSCTPHPCLTHFLFSIVCETIHTNVYCDICLNTIRGIRWKCQDCDNFDLCQGCHGLAGLRHPRHTFKPIEKHEDDADSSSSRPTNNRSHTDILHLASCDICLNPIVGVRHKCFQCPDYDLCQSCLPLAHAHHKGHTFIPISYPGQVDVKIDQTPQYGVVCDGCDSDIYGVRYKVKCVVCSCYFPFYVSLWAYNLRAKRMGVCDLAHIWKRVLLD